MLTSTTETLTTGQAAAVGAVIGGMFGAFLIFALIWGILSIIASWKIFEKAGEKGWKAIIPIYNAYIMFKIVNMKGWFWAILVLSVVGSIIAVANGASNIYYFSGVEAQVVDIAEIPVIVTISMVIEAVIAIIAAIIYAWRTSKVFGHSVGYFLGLIFLTPIFWLILGFGKSKYDKKLLGK